MRCVVLLVPSSLRPGCSKAGLMPGQLRPRVVARVRQVPHFDRSIPSTLNVRHDTRNLFSRESLANHAAFVGTAAVVALLASSSRWTSCTDSSPRRTPPRASGSPVRPSFEHPDSRRAGKSPNPRPRRTPSVRYLTGRPRGACRAPATTRALSPPGSARDCGGRLGQAVHQEY
jgi:hypothetical protein